VNFTKSAVDVTRFRQGALLLGLAHHVRKPGQDLGRVSVGELVAFLDDLGPRAVLGEFPQGHEGLRGSQLGPRRQSGCCTGIAAGATWGIVAAGASGISASAAAELTCSGTSRAYAAA